MSNNTVKASDIQAVPFFARFLEEQSAQPDNQPAIPQTLKYPSDWEDY
ncbi:microviridin/marinostatin family tricyclic proteinase inhibitor [Nostoc sp. CENA67]|uniref:Microviridin/marinostatin family tricyclic proteinase inhibitor n=1 Tax=Amazonocrinis nigriterrae CENA67 TaxID=2794033 RepID=A0A8J7HSB8_9NOST|nr:microviridin/marinostatin family tricyclic proteinase inhibitor [Amazonocrinis nigriterrae]MBH8562621.1 microviridin/marinostatin family tricyclic proteinase inhibitor [Amazonocrinis nigriterrae CENA67]MBH8562622.1 microviridin/marinostatin family tricyclic proteinase inhibitor [Amazonocrinis nigriterrae CENA67]